MALPILPSPPSWFTGQVVQAPLLRSEVSNTVQFFTQIPSFMGSQLNTGQVITNSTTTGVFIDAEYLDEWNGHRQNSRGGNYYGPIAGVYLAQAGIGYPGMSGQSSALIQFGNTTSSTVSFFGGQRVPNRASVNNQPYAAVLLAMVNIDGWGVGDFLGPATWQSSGSSQTLLNLTTQFPWFSCRLVGQLTSAILPVPSNPSFPTPPTVLTSSFLNTNITNAVDFLVSPPVFQGFYTAGTATLPSSASIPTTGTILGLDDIYVDTYSAYNSGAKQYVIPVSGIYFAYTCLSTVQASTGQSMAAGITITSSNYNSGSTFTYWGGSQGVTTSTTNAAVVKRRFRLNAGDTISPGGTQRDSASAAATINGIGNAPWFTTFFCFWESG